MFLPMTLPTRHLQQHLRTWTLQPFFRVKSLKKVFIRLLTHLSQKFLSQPFHVAETFTGLKGVYVPLKESIRGFKAIIDGEVDDLPEQAFFNVGTIDDAIEKAKTL